MTRANQIPVKSGFTNKLINYRKTWEIKKIVEWDVLVRSMCANSAGKCSHGQPTSHATSGKPG